MTDEQALLAAIRDDPTADAPRLVYADWLIEHDRPARAEVIFAQLVLHQEAQISCRKDVCKCDGGGGLCRACSDERDWAVYSQRENNAFGAYLLESGFNDHPSGFLPFGYDFNARVKTLTFEGRLYYRRGFIEEVFAPLARIESVWPCLSASHVVRSVLVADKKPLPFEGRFMWHNADHRFHRRDDGDTRPPDHLPGYVFDRLGFYNARPGRVTDAVRSYNRLSDAMRAMREAVFAGLNERAVT